MIVPFRTLRPFMLVGGIALFLLCVREPLLRTLHAHLADVHVTQLKERAALREDIRHVRDDAVTAQHVLKGHGTMSVDEIEKYLAPVNREKIVARLNTLATLAHFDAFTATLSPSIPNHDSSLTQSTLTLNGTAPHDRAVFSFADRLTHFLPGRARIKHMAIERLVAPSLTTQNVRFSLSFDWIANGEGR